MFGPAPYGPNPVMRVLVLASQRQAAEQLLAAFGESLPPELRDDEVQEWLVGRAEHDAKERRRLRWAFVVMLCFAAGVGVIAVLSGLAGARP